MKSAIIAAVSLALCLHLGYSRICYYCPTDTATSECTDTKNCLGDNMVCKTVVESDNVGFPFDGTEIVKRFCATNTTCLPSDTDGFGIDKPVFCCNVDYCNSQGLFANSSAVLTRPEIGKGAIGISVALVLVRL
ncbi:ly6/PLAUR domain-containing protein 2-like [Pseudophryne corroboree]|uniref:ly6/PLAUR domain-containing protein 2-like n=1 Tax=Pseudophryne corroboree TaxID=495146 RepID=UPI0030817E27